MNADVLSNIERLLADYERGAVSASEVERCLESHLGALERLSGKHIEHCRELVHQLVMLDLEADGISRQDASVRAHLATLRAWLDDVPA